MVPPAQVIETPAESAWWFFRSRTMSNLCAAAEDMADIRAYDRAKERLEAGTDEMIPADFADRILDGESPVRVWREYRGLSIKQLAAGANISAAYLSQIEGGSRNGSLSTLRALAKALSLDVDDLT